MSFQRNSNERRRRVLADEATAISAEAIPVTKRRVSTAAPRKMDRYTESADMQNQPRIVDLVPIRYLWLSIWSIAGLATAAALLAGHHYLRPILTAQGIHRTQFLDLAAPGNVASWFMSTTLLLAAVASSVVYSLRRLRMDDYKGRYRVWMVAAIVGVLLSIDETAQFRSTAQEVAIAVTKTPLVGDGSIWWIGGWSLLLTGLGIRLLLDSKQCKSSTAVFLFAAAFWFAAAAASLDLYAVEPQWVLMIAVGGRSLAYLTMLLGMTLHARHLILDIQGLLPGEAQPKTKKSKADVSGDADANVVKMEGARKNVKQREKRTDLDPVTPAIKMPEQTPKKPEPTPPAPAANESPAKQEFGDDGLDEDDLLESSGGHRKMSRGDRKKLRREQQQQHRKAG